MDRGLSSGHIVYADRLICNAAAAITPLTSFYVRAEHRRLTCYTTGISRHQCAVCSQLRTNTPVVHVAAGDRQGFCNYAGDQAAVYGDEMHAQM